MTRHSKNCTAGAYFTSEEKRKLKYGTVRERIGRDSIRRGDECNICVSPAEKPVVCSEGHLFCKECIIKYILLQKQKQTRQKELFNTEMKKREMSECLAEEERKRARIEEFEAKEAGRQAVVRQPSTDIEEKKKSGGAFWMNNATTSVSPPNQLPKKPESATISCPASINHSVSLKTLTDIDFSTNSKGINICKPCSTELNMIKGNIVAFPSCGCVSCEKCHLGGQSDSCVVCSQSSQSTPIIMPFEGTGYSASGAKIELYRHTPSLI